MSLNPLSTLNLTGYDRFVAATPIDRRLLIDPNTGTIRNSRLINSVTNDYVMGANGHLEGMSGIQQAVYLAIVTRLGSTAQYNLGQNLSSIRVIGSNTTTQIQNSIVAALNSLIINKQILVQNISVQISPTVATAALVTVNWIDLSTNNAQVTILGGAPPQWQTTHNQFSSPNIPTYTNSYIPFTPSSISGLDLWMDAGQNISFIASTLNVSTWTDIASSIVFTTNIGTQSYNLADKNYNNWETISFTGRMSATVSISQPFTVYVVGEIVATNNNIITSSIEVGNNSSAYLVASDGTNTLSSVVSSYDPFVVAAIYNGGNSLFYANAGSIPTSAGILGTAISGQLNIGGSGMTGKVATILIYSGAHNASNVKTIVDFLGEKYAIGVS